MSVELTVTYNAGGREMPLAVLRRAEGRIEYTLADDSPAIPFGLDEREAIICRLIDMPLRLYSLRHRTMPQLFEELQPGSAEHFNLLSRRYGPFSVGPRAGPA